MKSCKYSELHACDETCNEECRVMRTMKPGIAWEFQVHGVRDLAGIAQRLNISRAIVAREAKRFFDQKKKTQDQPG